MGFILLQVLPFGQHNTVVLPARAIHVVSASQQKLSGSPDNAHFVKSAAQVLSALSSRIFGLIYVAEAVVASTAARRKALRGPQRYAMG